jgi:hypothetical protein
VATVVRSYGDLLAVLQSSPETAWLIAVDGARAAGKSRVAKDLARDLPARCISVDDYLVQGMPLGTPYWDLVRLEGLAAAIEQARGESARVLVEGICLLSVLDRLNAVASLFVYVMRVSSPGDPCDIELFDDDVSETVLLDKIGPPQSTGASFDRDLAEYHKRIHPHKRADFVYEREES